MSLRDYNQI
jgi:hypothetical protein